MACAHDPRAMTGLHLHKTSRFVQEGSYCGHLGVRFHLVVEVAEKTHAKGRVQALAQLERSHTAIGGCIEVSWLWPRISRRSAKA